jgi:hypothetical protein
MKILIIVVLCLAGIIAGPLLLIWALNTLFNLKIVMSIQTWAAMAIVACAVGGAAQSSK